MNINQKTNAIILVPEITKGMKSIGSKALINISKEKSIIEYQIEYLQKHYPNISICVATGFDNEKIQKKIKKYRNIEIIYNNQYETTNHGMSIHMYMRKVNYSIDNLLIISNGILLKEKLDISDKNNSILFTLNKSNIDYSVGLNINKENKPIYLYYDLPISWSECVFLNKFAINKIKNNFTKHKLSQMFLFEIINYLLEDNGCDFIHKKIYNKNIFKINTIKNTNKAKIFYE